MAASVPRTSLVTWLALVVLTGASWAFGAGHEAGDGRAVSLAVIAIAFVKVRLVGRSFMELRDAPTVLRRLFDGWVAVVGGALALIYLLA